MIADAILFVIGGSLSELGWMIRLAVKDWLAAEIPLFMNAFWAAMCYHPKKFCNKQ